MGDKREYTSMNIKESDSGVYAYDLALVEDLKARFKSPQVNGSQVNDTVQIGSPESMYRIIGELNGDEVHTPFVSLQRISWQLNLDRQRISDLYRR